MSDSPDSLSALTPAPRLLSLQGRLGRIRYIAHCMLAVVLAFMFIYGAGWALLFSGPSARMVYVAISVLLFYGALPVFFAMQTVRRAHDFNFGGWLALLLLVPVVNLLFWFVPGTRGDNAYGPPPKEESPFVKFVAIAIPLLMIAGFLATAGSPQKAIHHLDVPHRTDSLQPYTP